MNCSIGDRTLCSTGPRSGGLHLGLYKLVKIKKILADLVVGILQQKCLTLIKVLQTLLSFHEF